MRRRVTHGGPGAPIVGTTPAARGLAALEEFLQAFGLEAERAHAAGRTSESRRRAEQESNGNHVAEVAAAAEDLERLVARVRELRALPFTREGVREIEETRKYLTEEWGHLVLENDWSTLPMLCPRCSRVVLVRASIWCSDACRRAAATAKSKARARRR